MSMSGMGKVRPLVSAVAGVHGYGVPSMHSSLSAVMDYLDAHPWNWTGLGGFTIRGETQLSRLMPWTARVVRAA